MSGERVVDDAYLTYVATYALIFEIRQAAAAWFGLMLCVATPYLYNNNQQVGGPSRVARMLQVRDEVDNNEK